MLIPRILFSPDAEPGLAANADAVIDAAPEGNADPIEPAKPTEDPQEQKITKIVAQRIKEERGQIETAAEARARQEAEAEFWNKVNPVIAKLGAARPDGAPVSTFDDLVFALEQRELQEQAAQQQIPVEILAKLQTTEATANQALSALSQYQRKDALTKEAEVLSQDPAWGEVFKAHEADIRKLADAAGSDLESAMLMIYRKIGPQKIDAEKIKEEGIQEYLDKKRTYKPVEGTGAPPVTVSTTPTNWAEAREGSRAILRAAREQ